MVTKPKSNSVITHRVHEDGVQITFMVKDAGEFTFNPTKASEANRDRAETHGWIQRISDGGALSRNPETGKPATPADKMARMLAIRDHYEAGGDVWGMKGSTGPRAPDAGLIITAMCRTVAKGDIDEANRILDKVMVKRAIDRAEALKYVASVKEVAEAIGQIKAERAAEAAKGLDLDADALMAELVDDEDDETSDE